MLQCVLMGAGPCVCGHTSHAEGEATPWNAALNSSLNAAGACRTVPSAHPKRRIVLSRIGSLSRCKQGGHTVSGKGWRAADCANNLQTEAKLGAAPQAEPLVD